MTVLEFAYPVANRLMADLDRRYSAAWPARDCGRTRDRYGGNPARVRWEL